MMMISIHPDLECHREHIFRIAGLLGIANLYVGVCKYGSRAHGDVGSISIDLTDCPRLSLSPEFVIAHELRHIFQMRNRWLTNFDSFYNTVTATWKSEHLTFIVNNTQEHWQTPWEVDANDFAEQYCRDYCSQECKAA